MQKINGINENILIDRLIIGENTAFELLFKFYYSGLVIYASTFILERDAAEGIIQEFFIHLWENHKKIKPSDSLKSYLFTSIKNRCLNLLKHKKIKERYVEELENLSQNNLIYNSDIYIASELQEKITFVVNNLPNRCKEVFTMSRFKGLSNSEIAQKLEITKRTVETQISNAIKILRHELKDYLVYFIILGLY